MKSLITSIKKTLRMVINYYNIMMIELLHLNPSRPDPGQREKLNLNFYFHTSLWCLKRFYGGLLRHHKEVWK